MPARGDDGPGPVNATVASLVHHLRAPYARRTLTPFQSPTGQRTSTDSPRRLDALPASPATVVHPACLFGKSPPDIVGVPGEMFAQFLQLPAELALLQRHHGNRRGNIRFRRFRGCLRCRRLRRRRSLGHPSTRPCTRSCLSIGCRAADQRSLRAVAPFRPSSRDISRCAKPVCVRQSTDTTECSGY
jgi:hypothetical protein